MRPDFSCFFSNSSHLQGRFVPKSLGERLHRRRATRSCILRPTSFCGADVCRETLPAHLSAHRLLDKDAGEELPPCDPRQTSLPSRLVTRCTMRSIFPLSYLVPALRQRHFLVLCRILLVSVASWWMEHWEMFSRVQSSRHSALSFICRRYVVQLRLSV